MNIEESKTALTPEAEPSAADLRAWIEEAKERQRNEYPRGSSAVLIPVLIRDGEYHVLYEVRSARLHSQPGEVCFPGGRIEQGEEPLEAAVREASEELCIGMEQIEVVGALDETTGPGGVQFYSFIGVLHGYEGTWSRDEVDHVFTLPLKWILEQEPDIYKVKMVNHYPEDFPFESVPGGRDYKWKARYYPVPFYPGTDPVLWGVTARVTHTLARLLKDVPDR